MEIDPDVATDPDSHDWVHYCDVRARLVGLRLSGDPGLVRFCPACGAAVSRERFRAEAALDRAVVLEAYGKGPLCDHGWPDVSCRTLLERDPTLELDFSVGVPEHAAARIVQEIEPDGVTIQWARPCAQCRAQFGRRRAPEIEVEIHAARKVLDARVRDAQRDVRQLSFHLNSLVGAMRLLSRQAEETPEDVPAHPGFVYAIGNTEALKIGWTAKHPRAENGRLAQLQIGNHTPLELLGMFAGTQADEYALHVRFAACRLRGEWFRAIPEIVEYFRES